MVGPLLALALQTLPPPPPLQPIPSLPPAPAQPGVPTLPPPPALQPVPGLPPLPSAPPAPILPPPPPASASADTAKHGLISLFAQMCTRAFPDDARFLEVMRQFARFQPLSKDEVASLVDGPAARGWVTRAGGLAVAITWEPAPSHSCGVHALGSDGAIDTAFWRQTVAAAEAQAGGGFAAVPVQTSTEDGVRTEALGDRRRNPDGTVEIFSLLRERPVDAAQAARDGVDIRLFHRILTGTR